MRDRLFQAVEPVHDFAFDTSVAQVFDDMLGRSIPLYDEVQRMVVELAVRFVGGSGCVYDIGCSTGNTLSALAEALGPQSAVRLVGLEPSEPMRIKARGKLAAVASLERFEILPYPVEAVSQLPGARVITLLYTLHFVRPVHRLKVLRMCYRSLESGGCLILAEKIVSETPAVRRLLIDLYHSFKRRSGYSAMEISRKREALENVLVPFMPSENIGVLLEAGFPVVEPIFQWYNFAAYLALKE